MRTIALDAETVTTLRGHKRRQQQERLAVGETWKETGFVLTQPDIAYPGPVGNKEIVYRKELRWNPGFATSASAARASRSTQSWW
jgi:hypothetical protein